MISETNTRYIEAPACSTCGQIGVVGILQRKSRDSPWYFCCGFCGRIYTENRPRSGRLSDGIHADLWLLENER